MSEPDSPAPTTPVSPEATGAVDGSAAPDSSSPVSTLESLKSLLTQATQHLLGSTIDVTDEQWRQPSRLPNWSRAMVATHLARNAEGIARLASWARTGTRQDMYASEEQRDSDVEAGADRPGLELQVDLDTTAGLLQEAFAALDDEGGWDVIVDARGSRLPARMLPLVRLGEVVLHHVDLDAGYGIGDVDEDTAGWLLEYVLLKLRDRQDFPRLELHSDSGLRAQVGAAGESRQVSGSSRALLGWLTGRGDGAGVAGAEGIDLSPF